MSSPEREKTTSGSKTNGESTPASKAPFSPRISQTLETLQNQSEAVRTTASKIASNALSGFERTLTGRLKSVADTSTVALEVALQEGIQSARSHQESTWRALREHQQGIWNEMKRTNEQLSKINDHLERHTTTLSNLAAQTWRPIVISAVIGLLIIGLSWYMRPGLPNAIMQVKTRSGETYLVVTDPEWEICQVEGKNRPCKRRR